MKIEVNIERKYFYIIISLIFFLLGTLVVVAFNPAFLASPKTKEQAAQFGHSADELVVGIISNKEYTLQQALSFVGGVAQCELTAKELRENGCPEGSYLYKAQVVSPTALGNPLDAYCKLYFTTSTFKDESGNPIIPSCYPRDGTDGTTTSPVEGVICNADGLNDCINGGGDGSIYICKGSGESYRWRKYCGGLTGMRCQCP